MRISAALGLIYISITLFAYPRNTSAHMSGEGSFTCPICKTQFKAEVDISGTSFGKRLDLKPLGAIAAPWRIPVCPKCHFVLYTREELASEKIKRLRKIINSKEYKSLVEEKHSSYYLLGFIQEKTGVDDFDIGWSYIQASWQVEQKQEQYEKYLSKALSHIEKFAKKGNRKDERWPLGMHLTGELMRLTGRFQKAKSHLLEMSKDPIFKKQPYRTLVAYEISLVEKKDRKPHEIPAIEQTEKDKQDTPGYKKCASLTGFSKVTKRFKIEDAKIGFINLAPKSLFVRLSGLREKPVNDAWWYNPVDGEEPKHDWLTFLATFDRINKAAARHPWLAAWQKGKDGRRIEAHFIGKGTIATFEFEKFVLPPWKHAKLEGKPQYELLLREQDDAVASIFISDKEKRALITSLKRSEGIFDYEVFYHPTQEIPQYIVVDPDGTRHINKRPK